MYAGDDTWAYMIAYDGSAGHIALKVTSGFALTWATKINCDHQSAGQCYNSTYGFSDSDGTNIHSAYTVESPSKYTIYYTLDIDTGLTDITLKQTISLSSGYPVSSTIYVVIILSESLINTKD